VRRAASQPYPSAQVARLIEILVGFDQRVNSFFAVVGGGWQPCENVDEAIVLLDELGFPRTTSRRLKAVLRPNHRFSPAYRQQRCNEVVRGLIKRLRSGPIPAVSQRMDSRSGRLVDPIPVVRVANVVGRKAGRPDKLPGKMRLRNYPTRIIARKWHCQRADAIAMFSRYKARIEEI